MQKYYTYATLLYKEGTLAHYEGEAEPRVYLASDVDASTNKLETEHAWAIGQHKQALARIAELEAEADLLRSDLYRSFLMRGFSQHEAHARVYGEATSELMERSA